jgi:hypothetical protein
VEEESVAIWPSSQQPSTTINNHQQPSTTINNHQQPSTNSPHRPAL